MRFERRPTIERIPQEAVSFGPFRIDPRSGGLWLDGARVHLRPKTWEVLCLLVANPGRLLTKDDVLDAVWAGASVSDTMPSISVAELRRALQDDAKRPRYIETVHGRGFRFIADLVDLAGLTQAHAASELPGAETDLAPHLGAHGETPFVGRAAELARLDDLIVRGDPQCRVMLVCGDPGIGKTTLVNHFLSSFVSRRVPLAGRRPRSDPQPSDVPETTRDVLVGRGQCLAHFGEGHPHLPIFGALRSMCSGRAQVLALLRATAPSWLGRLPDLVSTAELDKLRHSTATSLPTRVLDEMVALVRAVGPLVWVLEDMHWADEATLELITLLAENLTLADFRVIGTVRLAEAVGRAHPVTRMRRELLRRNRCREILLEGLSESDVEQYLSGRLRGMSYPDWLAKRLLTHSNGNPFFLAHTVDQLQSKGGLRLSGELAEVDQARLEAALDTIPETLRDLIQEDIERLDEAQQRILGAASVAGLEVDAAMVAAASGTDVEASDTTCAELARRTPFLQRVGETTWPDGTVSGRYAFRHALYQKVLYENLPPAARRASHCRIGRALVAAYGEGASDNATVVADHFERGGDKDQAVTYHLLAARVSSKRYASREAALHLRRALTLLPFTTNDRERREAVILAELGKVLPALQGFGDPALHELYIRARTLRTQGADASSEASLLIGHLLANLMQRRPQPAEELAREMLEMTSHAADPATRARAEILMGAVLYHQGDLAGTMDHADRALTLAPQTLTFGPLDLHCGALVMSGAALWQAGDPDAGLARAVLGLNASDSNTHPFNRVIALQPLLAIHQWRGDVGAAITMARELATSVDEQGIVQAEACALLIEGWTLFESGTHAAAAGRIEKGLEALRAHGTMMQSVYLLSVAIEVMVGLGRVQEAGSLLHEAAGLIEDGAARWWEPELHRWRGVLLCLPEPGAGNSEAAACFQASLDLATLQGSASLYLRTATSLARMRQSQRRHAEARRIVERALLGIRGGADTRDVQAAQGLLAAVERPSG